uniref:Uncharacterized protein n=1 Tax=Clastoptera arizonana TaxID=38151 RepID=A0A1B6DM22_9HEMI
MKSLGVRLLKAKDSLKDQSFFLSNVNQIALQKTMFPLGNYTKAEVKNIAKENGFLNIARRKESMGMCFIGSRNFSKFISQYIPNKSGLCIQIDSGNEVGRHSGVHQWAMGQRFKMGGQRTRQFICGIDSSTQNLYIATGKSHPSLWGQFLRTYKPHWIHSIPAELTSNKILFCDFRFRHNQPLAPCKLLRLPSDNLVINVMVPIQSIAKGQFAVFYRGNECLGSAKITAAGPSLYSLTH